MKQVILLVALWTCFASAALANCNLSKMPDKPTIPTGDSASYTEMAAAQASVKAYIDQARQHLNCLYTTRKYNHTVNKMLKLADNYNSELRVFKTKEAARLAVNNE